MYRLRSVITSGLLIAFLSGCSAFIQEPRVAIKGTSPIGMDASGIDLDFLLGVTNPNTFDLSLLGYTYELQIMTLPFSSCGKQETVVFPAGKETDIHLPVHLTFSDLLEIIKQHPDPDKLPYRIAARLILKSPLGEMVIPVEKIGTLKVPERYRPKAAIDRLSEGLRGFR